MFAIALESYPAGAKKKAVQLFVCFCCCFLFYYYLELYSLLHGDYTVILLYIFIVSCVIFTIGRWFTVWFLLLLQGTMSQEEWDVVGLYLVFVFQKKRIINQSTHHHHHQFPPGSSWQHFIQHNSICFTGHNYLYNDKYLIQLKAPASNEH